MRRLILILFCLSIPAAAHAAGTPADLQPKQCGRCAEWTVAVEPFLLAPNTWFVGSKGLSSVLIDSGAGLVLIDAGLPQSAPAIATAIRRLGFRVEDLRYLLNSHAHFDHAGGIAALARWSGAEVLASEDGAKALRLGDISPDDPQAVAGDGNRFPAVPAARGMADGATLTLGSLNITIHHTPGHAPGGASYSWAACDGRGDCTNVVYADSLTAVSAPGYRFSGHPLRLAALEQSFARIAALDCDVLVTAHPEFSALFERRDRDALLTVGDCTAYAERSAQGLAKRLDRERAE